MAERKRETLAVFDDAEEARVAQSMLDGAGIASFVEEAEGDHPDHPAPSTRARLLVDAADLARARDFFVKDDPEDTPDEGDSDRADVARRTALRRHPDSTAASPREESARRAFYASITACMLGALLVPAPPALLLLVPAGLAMVSLFFLVDVAWARGPLGIRARRMGWAALAIDATLLALVILVVAHRRG